MNDAFLPPVEGAYDGLSMVTRLKGIMIVWVALLIGASWSACCCQSDWIVREGVRLLSGDVSEAAGCGCCEVEQNRRERDGGGGAPLRERECTPSIAKTVPSGPVQAADVVATGWVWVELVVEPSREVGCREPVIECRGPRRVDGTLLGLGCALVV